MRTHTRHHLLLLLTALACAIQSALCQQCPYSPPLCECSEFGIRCFDVKSIPPLETDPNVVSYTSLKFDGGNISSVHKASLPPGLMSLYFTGHPLTDISDDAFDNSATTLVTLTISRAKFKQLPRALTKLTKLASLEISDTPLEVLDSSLMPQVSKSLTSLKLRNTSLSAWPNLTYFSFLQNIDISKNVLTSIPDDAFSSFKDVVKNFNLANANLTHVPKALSTLKNLTDLDLNDNTFTDVNEFDTVFTSGSKLKKINLYSTKLTAIPNFSKLLNLEDIYLSNNNISDANSGSFPPSVETLILSSNNLSSVPTAVANMSQLVSLDLSTNAISEIKPNSFPQGLYELFLNSNNITDISNLSFPPNLADLDLNFNHIEEINRDMFPAGLSDLGLTSNKIKEITHESLPSSLSSISLGYNQITRIAPNSFPSNLTTIELSHNNLTAIDNTTFANLIRLESLTLQRNPISTISVEAFSDLKSLRSVYLDSTNLTEIPLALTKLSNPNIIIRMRSIATLNCSCLAPDEVATWATIRDKIRGLCNDGEYISVHLMPCVTTTKRTTTTPAGHALNLKSTFSSILGSLLLLLSLRI